MTTTHTRTTTRHGRVITGKSDRGRALRSNEDMVTFWIEGLYEREPQGYASASPSSSIIVDGDKIFSFGTHFEMARILRRESGVPRMILISADTWSSAGWGRTSDHQGYVRHAVATHNTNELPVLIVPFSTLDAAGIAYDSIRPLEIRPDRHTTHDMSSMDRPGHCVYVRDNEGVPKYIGAPNEGDDRERDPNLSSVERTGMAHAYSNGPAVRGEDGVWRWKVQRHWLGDSIFRAKSRETRQRKLTTDELELQRQWRNFMYAADEFDTKYRQSFVPGEGYDERWYEIRQRVRYEAAEIQSKLPPATQVHSDRVSYTVERWATYLSAFDYDEPHRPYFMCELPFGSNACTVDDGFATLMPMQVSAHIGLGDDVKRQGDVYAIAAKYTTAELESLAEPTTVKFNGRYEERVYMEDTKPVTIRRRFASLQGTETYEPGALDILGTNHQATHVIKTKDGRWFGRGRMIHSPAGREPDHRVVKLADGVWYEFIKNTVPESKAQRGGRVNQQAIASGHSRAWSLGGMVD